MDKLIVKSNAEESHEGYEVFRVLNIFENIKI